MSSSALRYDIALAAEKGRRDYQEDAIAARFSSSKDIGYVVVADGMGGHQAGDVASKLVASSWSAVIDNRISDEDTTEGQLADTLPLAAMEANEAIASHVRTRTINSGMGSTLLGTIFVENRVYWISIGDSPLYLFRDGALLRVNEDHSMAPSIDKLVAQGVLSHDEARDHPDRSCLTSALMGAEISRVDCPEHPRELLSGDVMIVASDGLQHLEIHEIENVLRANQGNGCQVMLDHLMQAIRDADVPDQDNTSVAIVALKQPANTPFPPQVSTS